MKTYLTYLPAILFLFGSSLNAYEKTPIYIGFWEKDGVRKAFEYKDGKWQSSLLKVDNSEELSKAASKYASPSEWTLFFDGKTYGNISTKPFGAYATYKENGLQKIVSKEPQLNFRKIDKKFSDWNGENIRPVLASNSENLSDPDQWKPSSSKTIRPSILKDLKKHMKGKVYFCKSEDCEGTPLSRDLKDTEISLSASYKDIKGNELNAVVLKFSPKDYAYCEIEGDGCRGEGPFWYLGKPSAEPQFLTSAAALVDTADLNHDGSSELVFWIDEYNSNGYELIDGKSLAKQRSSWSYH